MSYKIQFIFIFFVLIGSFSLRLNGQVETVNTPFHERNSSSLQKNIPQYISFNETIRQEENNTRRKSSTLAVVYSLLVPGLGEWYAGNFSTGRYFLAADAGFWFGIVGLNSYGTWLRNDARRFAVLYAGIDPTSKDSDFFVNIGNFMSLREYNEKKLRDRNYAALYNDPAYDWNWKDDSHRREYRDLRVRSDKVLNSIQFVAVALVANRIVSAVVAGNFVRRYNNGHSQNSFLNTWEVRFIPFHNGFGAQIQHSF